MTTKRLCRRLYMYKQRLTRIEIDRQQNRHRRERHLIKKRVNMKGSGGLQIVGRRVLLVPFTPKHVSKYHQWLEDPYLREMTASEPITMEQAAEIQRDWSTDPKKLAFIILDASHEHSLSGDIDAMAGDVNLLIDRDDASVAEVLVMVAEPSMRRKGLASAAVELIMWYGRRQLNISRFTCKISEDNQPSLACFEKLGFVRVAFSEAFREHELSLSVSDPNLRPDELLNVRPYVEVDPPALPAESRPAPAAPSASAPSAVTVVEVPSQIKTAYGAAVVGDGLSSFPVCAHLTLVGESTVVVSLISSSSEARDATGVEAMGTLSVGIVSRFDHDPIVSTLLRGDDELTQLVVQQLAKKTKFQCFVSSSLPEGATPFAFQITSMVLRALAELSETKKMP